MIRADIIVFLLTVEPAVDIGLWVSRGQHHHLPVFLLLLLMVVVDLKTEVEVVLLEANNVLFPPCCRSFLIL